MSGQKNKMQKSFGPQKFDYKKFYPKSFVKIRSVTADIFLIWTNVAWTNVIMAVGIGSKGSQEPTFKVWSKLGK